MHCIYIDDLFFKLFTNEIYVIISFKKYDYLFFHNLYTMNDDLYIRLKYNNDIFIMYKNNIYYINIMNRIIMNE